MISSVWYWAGLGKRPTLARWMQVCDRDCTTASASTCTSPFVVIARSTRYSIGCRAMGWIYQTFDNKMFVAFLSHMTPTPIIAKRPSIHAKSHTSLSKRNAKRQSMHIEPYGFSLDPQYVNIFCPPLPSWPSPGFAKLHHLSLMDTTSYVPSSWTGILIVIS